MSDSGRFKDSMMNKATIQVFLLLFAPFAVAPIAVGTEHDDARALVDRYYSQFQKPGFLVDELVAFYADDIKFTDPTFEIVADGKSEVRALYADLGTGRTSYRDIAWTIRSVTAGGGRIVIRGNWSGRFHHCEFDVEFMTLWVLRDGLIAEQNDFFAASTFDRQVAWDPVKATATCESN